MIEQLCVALKAAKNSLSYFHLELEDHQVIFAEGAPVKSALGDRMIPFAPFWFDGRKSLLNWLRG